MVASVPERFSVETRFTWDIERIFSDLSSWTEAYRGCEPSIEKVAAFQGTLSQSPKQLADALFFYLNTMREIERLYTFSHLLSDSDTSNSENLGVLERARGLFTRFSAASSFITPELLAIDPVTLFSFLKDPALKDLRNMIEKIVRHRPHILSESEEKLLALGSEIYGAAGQIYSQLSNADLTFGTIAVAGNDVALTQSSFVVLLKNADRDVRKRTFEQYYKVFEGHRFSISCALSASVKSDVYLSTARKHSSSLESALFEDNISTAVYENLVRTVSAGLTPLHNYYSYRAKQLKLADSEIYDTYVPLVADVDASLTYNEACSFILKAVETLGAEYHNTLQRGFTTERWVDIYENKGKRSGAYSSGCYDSYPYMLMNYQDEDLDSVFTLAHEAGHSMHSYFAQNYQPYQDYNYSIFVAEVASTFNEQLLLYHLKQHYANDKRMLAYLINKQLDDIKGTFYRQTMFAEFEQIIHSRAEAHDALTVDVLCSCYENLLKKYYGPAVNLHPFASLECLRIPHFYSAFYVYQYATGLSAAIALSELVLNGGNAERTRYLNFLKGGGSKYSLELLKDAGVDMSSPAPIQTTIGVFEKLLKELESLL